MKNLKLCLSTFMLCAVGAIGMSSCGNNAKITSYYLNSSGELVAVYDNGGEENLGNWNKEIVESLHDVSISADGYFVINGIKTNIKATETLVGAISMVTISDDGYYVINGVKTNIQAIEVYTVAFDTGFEATIQPQKVKDGYKVEKPNLARDGYTLNGWFCNGEEWRFNSDIVKNDMTLTASWTANHYTVSFVNEKGTNPEDMIVEFGSNVTLPTVDSVTGFIFNGWYYENNKVNDGKWSIASNVTLNAKWSAAEYTITMNPNGGRVSKTTQKVKYGESYVLPVPTNSFGAFKGWYYGDTKITDEQGRSIEPYAFTSNITVSTNWIEEIFTKDQLKAISQGLNGHYKLVADIDLSEEEWIPIGNALTPFAGRFDGNGFKISGLSISMQRAYEGLFGYNVGTIENVLLEDALLNIGAVAQSSYVGAVIGYNAGTVDNCEVSGSVTTKPHASAYETYTGGLIGYNSQNGIVKDSTNNAAATGINYVAGVVAFNEGTLRGLTNNGSVASNVLGAGIVASSNKGFSYCTNNGSVTANSYAAGIIATVPKGIEGAVSYCKNTGNIVTQSCGGGILGYHTDVAGSGSSYFDISKCVNTGNVTSSTTSEHIGGIIGFTYSTHIDNCYSVANITGADYAGGIIGYGWNGSITNCYSVGSLSSRSRVGGIGGIYNGSFNQCYTNVIVQKGAITGTINGLETDASNLTNCYYSGSKANSGVVSYFAQGTQTEVRFDEDFYLNSLFWSDSVWSFSGVAYPTLVWEA